MRLKTKLVLTASGLTFAVVLVLCVAFLSELLRQRVEQTFANNDVLAHEVLLVTRQAVESGLRADPPADTSDAALEIAVTDALRSSVSLKGMMTAILRYSPTVQDVSVTDAQGVVLISTDPDTTERPSDRPSFAALRAGGLAHEVREILGRSRVLDISAPLDRNGRPFLAVHVGVRSTFVRNNYAPWLNDALWFTFLAAAGSMAAAALLSNVALYPLKAVGEQLERLRLSRRVAASDAGAPLLDAPARSVDALDDVNRSIDRLGRQMRTQEEGYTALQANMDRMLDALRDGVLLFNADECAVMVSDAVEHFLQTPDLSMASQVGKHFEEIFLPRTALGEAVRRVFRSPGHTPAETVTVEDGRQIEVCLDRVDGGAHDSEIGALLTLRDAGSARQLEQELEVSRRLAAIGRLTAGVGHEVKNPINAMVVHLELLRGKLAAGNGGIDSTGAQRHVEILTDEMRRLDRVVQTLADFSRPMELNLREHDLRSVVDSVFDLAGAEFREHRVAIAFDQPAAPVMVRADAELIRQALLNLFLNAMQAMPEGGLLRVTLRRESRMAVIEIADEGEGIPASLLPRIFDLYFTTKPKGSGIGLSMTYRILQMHGGAMDVRSNTDRASRDRGTLFTLHLPTSVPAESRSGSGRGIEEPMTASAEASFGKAGRSL